MTAVPILSGVTGSETAEFVQSWPLNLEPIIVDSQISKGQLRSPAGAVQIGTGPGVDRGGILWNGVHYRVMGTKLVTVASEGTVSVLGDVGDGGRCALDYSFDRLIINSGADLYYYDPANGLIQVTDTDLGAVVDALWIDGYTMTTDGTYVLVTELNDPTSVKPLKYGSAEEDPDPITGLLKYRDIAYVVGRHTIQMFQNVGGNGFPFSTVEGGTIPFGCVGPKAKCLYVSGFAFVGSGRNQALNVYAGAQGQAAAIGCRALCDALAAVEDVSLIEVEARNAQGEDRLLVHLPAETWVFLAEASKAAQQAVWHRIRTDASGYRCRNAVQAFGETYVGDTQSGAIGILSSSDRKHFGIDPDWQFDCGMLYLGGIGGIVHSIELVGLPGRGGNGAVFMSMTRDGETFGIERSVELRPNERVKRIAWRPHTRIGNYMGLRFRGNGSSLPGIAGCDVKILPLAS